MKIKDVLKMPIRVGVRKVDGKFLVGKGRYFVVLEGNCDHAVAVSRNPYVIPLGIYKGDDGMGVFVEVDIYGFNRVDLEESLEVNCYDNLKRGDSASSNRRAKRKKRKVHSVEEDNAE